MRYSINASIDVIKKFTNDKLISFKEYSIKEKNDSFFSYFLEDCESEISFLEQINLLEKKLSLNFTPFNWPKGFRFESSFSSYVVYDTKMIGFKKYKSYYIIRIEQDVLEKRKHRVFFNIPETKEEVSLDNILNRLGKDILSNDTSLDSELQKLSLLTNEELNIIGNLFLKEESITSMVFKNKKNNNNFHSIEVYLKLLKIKHNFTLLRSIENDDYALIEGILQFEPMYKSKYRVVFREIEKYKLGIRIYNNDINNIYFMNFDKELSLHDIFNYMGIRNIKNNNEFEHLITFSDYDLNLISLIMESM